MESALQASDNIYRSSEDTTSCNTNRYLAHGAAWDGDVKAIREDLGRSWGPDQFGLYPSHIAVLRQKPEILKVIIQQGMDTPMWAHSTYGGLTLAGFTIVYEETHCMAAILSFEEGRERHLNMIMGENRGTLLHLAIETNALKSFRNLFVLYPQQMIQMLENRDKEGRSPMSLASALGRNVFIEYLEQFGANLETKDNLSRRPMHWAAMRGQQSSVTLLAGLGASLTPLDHENKRPDDYLDGVSEPDRESIRRLIGTLDRRKSNAKLLLPDMNQILPHNCIFSGGGVRCLSLIGAVRYCYENKKFHQVRRFAGTSGGAILASLLAVGYTPNELETALKRVSLVDLIDDPRAGRSVLRSLKAGIRAFKMFTEPREVLQKVITSATGFCGAFKGEAMRSWIDELIRNKTGKVNCTFKELRSLVVRGIANGHNDRHRHLYVVCTRLGKAPKIVTPNSEDSRWDNYIISDAVLGSACFPLVFKPHELCVKIWDEGDGRRVARRVGHAPGWQVLDGGFVMNCAYKLFDQSGYQRNGLGSIASQFPMHNLRTLAFRLYSPNPGIDTQKKEKQIKSSMALLKQIMLIYFHAEQMLNKNNAWDDQRIVPISNQGVFTFQLLNEQLIGKQLKGGYQDAETFFTGQSHGQGRSLDYDDGEDAGLLITPESRKEVAKLNRRAKIEGTVSAALFATSGASLGAGVAAAPFTGGLSMIPAGAVAGVTAIPAAGTAIAGYVHRRRAKKKEEKHRQIEDAM